MRPRPKPRRAGALVLGTAVLALAGSQAYPAAGDSLKNDSLIMTIGAMDASVTRGGISGDSMMAGVNGWTVEPIFTFGETIGAYTPPGIVDGLGAYELDEETVRVLANHELRHTLGYSYELSDGFGGTFALTGARVSYFDIDKASRQIVASGLAYRRIYDAFGLVVSDPSFLANDHDGLSRFCSSSLYEPNTFGLGRGLRDRIYFAGEEEGGSSAPVGGAEWALDPATGDLWQLPDLGRGGWENVAVVDTGSQMTVGVILASDTAPFDVDGDGDKEAAPLFLYLGDKNLFGDFPAQNGLRDGSLHVWVSDTFETSPLEFRGSGTLSGRWVAIDNGLGGPPSEDGATGFDEYGYPTQRNLWIQAEALGAFGFSRPEDLATNPSDGSEVVLASTGVDTYAVDPVSGDGADTFGTVYLIDTDFSDLSATLTILYDGDADPSRALRSPDNLDWADDGLVYVQEDEAEESSLTGEPLFGPGAANPNEAGIVALDPVSGDLTRVANIDRSVVLDGSLADPTLAVDEDAGKPGEWETSGILDVSGLFGEPRGTLFLFDVQAHGIRNQDLPSRINNLDLVQGGQLSFLAAPRPIFADGFESGDLATWSTVVP